MRLTEHFTLDEFLHSQTAVRHGIDNSLPEGILPNIHRLAERMEEIRFLLKHPVIISSGYRCPELNRKIGGSKTSRHMMGLAADFTCPGFGSPFEVAEVCAAHLLNFDQIIYEGAGPGAWVHFGLSESFPRMQILTAKFPKGKAVYHNGLIK